MENVLCRTLRKGFGEEKYLDEIYVELAPSSQLAFAVFSKRVGPLSKNKNTMKVVLLGVK